MKAQERTQNSLEKLTNAIRSMQWDLLSPTSLDRARSYSKKYGVTVVLLSYLTKLGYIQKQSDGKVVWSLNPVLQDAAKIADLVMQKNKDAVNEWARKKRDEKMKEKQKELKQKEKELQKSATVQTLFSEEKPGRSNVVSTQSVDAETLLRLVGKLEKNKQIELAVVILKAYGYKIMQPITEFKEL